MIFRVQKKNRNFHNIFLFWKIIVIYSLINFCSQINKNFYDIFCFWKVVYCSLMIFLVVKEKRKYLLRYFSLEKWCITVWWLLEQKRNRNFYERFSFRKVAFYTLMIFGKGKIISLHEIFFISRKIMYYNLMILLRKKTEGFMKHLFWRNSVLNLTIFCT